jgi:type IV secretory pathway TrbD component
MLDKQRTMAESAGTVMKEHAAEQAAADRTVVVANGIVTARLGKVPQSWTQIDTQGVPSKNIAVSWHNFGNAVALILSKEDN